LARAFRVFSDAYINYSRLGETTTQVYGRLFLSANPCFLFDLRVEFGICSYRKGLTGKNRAQGAGRTAATAEDNDS
jgi:hypothetical protein